MRRIQVQLVDRGGPHPVRIIYTGHPPVIEQLRGQVRSPTGMTFGLKTHDGAKMPPGFTSYQFPREAAAPEPAHHQPRGRAATISDDIIPRLRALADDNGMLPPRSTLRAAFGRNLVRQLHFLESAGCIRLWVADPGGNTRGIAIRIPGSDLILRTPDAPADALV